MDTPGNDVVVSTHHIYTFAALMCIALVASAILFLMIDF
jgi:hypothetical protein